MDLEDDVEKALAKVDEAAQRDLGEMKAGIAAWMVGAVLAVAAAAVVFWVLESHSRAPQAAKPSKPVEVRIVPADGARK